MKEFFSGADLLDYIKKCIYLMKKKLQEDGLLSINIKMQNKNVKRHMSFYFHMLSFT